MPTKSIWGTIIAVGGVLIAFFEITLAVYKYIAETERQKYKDTINIFNSLFEDTYLLKEKYLRNFPLPLFNAELICSNDELYKETMNLLTRWESFSRGLYYNVYNFKIFIYLTPKELAELLNLLEDFVIKERIRKNYERLFQDFSSLTHDISMYVQMKIEGKRILSKHAIIRRLK